MPHRPKQFTLRHRFTTSNRLTALRSRQFIINFIRAKVAVAEPEAPVLLGSARLQWITAKKNHKENRIGQRASCIITGRNRSVSGRYNVSRIQIKGLSNSGQLFGARKSSW